MGAADLTKGVWPPRVDLGTVLGLGLLLMPLTTMWHEIGGHAAACAVQGGHVTELGAFYVDCRGLTGWPDRIVAIAGALVDGAGAALAFLLWRRARRDMARLVWWLIWVDKAFTAAGYLCFSGATGLGDLGPGAGGGIGPLPVPAAWRAGELVVGALAYVLLVRAAIRSLSTMLGTGAATRSARRRIAHGYYLASGVAAVAVGLLNPLGLFITLASAAASSFGGLAGFISIGFACPPRDAPQAFSIERRWTVVAAGLAATGAFALVLGPTVRF